MDFNILVHSPFLAYALIFAGMSVEATVTLFSTVFILSLGHLNPAVCALVIVGGAVTEQLVWYYLGYNLHRFKRIVHFGDRFVGHLDRHFLDRPLRVLVLSKFIYGLHRTVLLRFGMLKFPVKKFLKDGVVAVLAWLAIVGGLAYGFSASYEALKRYFRYGELLILLFVAVFAAIQYFVSKRLKKDL